MVSKENRASESSSSTMCRAVLSLPSAMTSNQSRAQLKRSGRGQAKPSYADS